MCLLSHVLQMMDARMVEIVGMWEDGTLAQALYTASEVSFCTICRLRVSSSALI